MGLKSEEMRHCIGDPRLLSFEAHPCGPVLCYASMIVPELKLLPRGSQLDLRRHKPSYPILGHIIELSVTLNPDRPAPVLYAVFSSYLCPSMRERRGHHGPAKTSLTERSKSGIVLKSGPQAQKPMFVLSDLTACQLSPPGPHLRRKKLGY